MIIVGGGIIGLSCAWRLAQERVPVTVFDAREVAREASWAGAGMLAPGGEVERDGEATRMAIRSLAAYPSFIRELEEETGAVIDFRRCGGLEIAFTEDEAALVESHATTRAGLGIASEPERRPGAAAARLYPEDSTVDPRQITAALRTACTRRGVVFREHEPVLEVFEEGAVRTRRGEYRDATVLIAAGAWSSELLAYGSAVALPKTTPVRGHLIAYNGKPGLLTPILRHANTYVFQRKSGSVIAGSSTEHVGFDRNLSEPVLTDIHARAERLLPELAHLQVADRWNGFRPAIDADGPSIGRIAPGLWAAFGHYRNGILLAPETARRIVEAWRGSH